MPDEEIARYDIDDDTPDVEDGGEDSTITDEKEQDADQEVTAPEEVIEPPEDIFAVLRGERPLELAQPSPQAPQQQYQYQPAQYQQAQHIQPQLPSDELAATNPREWLIQSLNAMGLNDAISRSALTSQQVESAINDVRGQLWQAQQRQVATAKAKLQDAARKHYQRYGKNEFWSGDEKVKGGVNSTYRDMMASAIQYAERTGDTSPLEAVASDKAAELIFAAGLIEQGINITELARRGGSINVRGAEPSKSKRQKHEASADSYFTRAEKKELREAGYSDADIADMAKAATEKGD